MRLRINTYVVASMAFSIITLLLFWAFSSLFAETSIFYMGLPFALSAFLFSYAVLRRDGAAWSFKIAHAQIPNIMLGVITIFSVLAVLFVPAYDGSILEWVNIPLMNWLRYAASILLIMFLPGYFLLRIFDSQNSLELYAIIPLSYVLSMFITFVTGFGLLLAYNSILPSASFLLIAVTLTLMVAYFVRSSLNHHSATAVNLSLIEVGALFATLAITLVGDIYVMSSTLPLSMGDMWRHLAQALQYSKGFPIHEGMLIPGYPYLFHICLATFFQLSGLSSSISYQALFALSFIPVLSFYSLIKRWFSKENVVSIAVLLVSLLGFGSLYALNLKVQDPAMSLSAALSNAIPKTYDIMNIMIIGPTHSNVVPIIFIALPTLFMFLYLLRKNMNTITKTFLYAVLVAVSFLGHPDASFFMGLALLFYSVMIREDGVKAGALGGILGLLLVALVDISAPARIYTWGLGVSSASTMTLLVTFFLFALSYVYSLARRHIQINRDFLSNNFKRNTFSFISWGIIGTYFFSLITWLYVLPNYNAYTFGGYNFTPFFVWSIRFGPIGLLAVLCLGLYLGDVIKDKNLTFFAAIAASGFVMEQIANYYSVYPAYRFATLTLIGVVPLAAYFVVKSYLRLAGKKRILLTAILISLVIPGMFSSVLFYYDRAQYKSTINNSELAALNFIGKNLPSNSSVLTFTSNSEEELETFAGVNTVQGCYRWSSAFLSAQDISVILYLLGRSNVRYLYLSTDDWKMLNSSQSTLRDLLAYFPVPFHNDYVTILEVPRLSVPSNSSKLAILNFLDPTTLRFQNSVAENDTMLMSIPSFLSLNYSINWLPLQGNISKVVIDNFENASSWNVYEGSGNITIDTADIVGSTPTLAVQDVQADKSGYFAVGKYGTWNFTGYASILLWIKVPTDMQGFVKIVLRGNNGQTWMQWFVSDFPRDAWVQLNLPFTSPTGTGNPPLNLTDIQHIDIGFATKSFTNSSFFKISDLVLAKEYTPILPSQEVANLLNSTSVLLLTHDPNADLNTLIPWIESGNRIMVLNDPQNNAGGFFSDFLKLESKGQNESNEIEFPMTTIKLPELVAPILSSEEPDVTPILWYGLNSTPISPFALSKRIGSGEIIYLALPSELLEPGSENLPIVSEILGDVMDFIKFNIDNATIAASQLPSYSMAEGYFNATGSVKIVTTHLLNAAPIKAKVKIETENSSMVFGNVTVNSLAAYSSTITAQNISMTIGTGSLPASYLSVSSLENNELNPIELAIGQATLSITNSSDTINLSVKNALINIYASDFSFFVRSPMIESKGETHLPLATITYGGPYTPLAGAIREGIVIKGTAIITSDFSTNNLMVINNFWYSGTATKDQMQAQATFVIPWFNLLTSPIFFVFLMLILTVVFIELCPRNELTNSNRNHQERQ